MAGAADAGGDGGVQGIGQLLLDRLDRRVPQTGGERAHPAGDIESHPAGGDHAAGVGIESRHPADGEAVAPVGVRHGIGGLDDTGQAGHVGELFIHLLIHIEDQLLAGIDDPRHPHRPAGPDMPFVRALPPELCDFHTDYSSCPLHVHHALGDPQLIVAPVHGQFRVGGALDLHAGLMAFLIDRFAPSTRF